MAEIFRHFRPLKFDRSRVTVTPLSNGGVSYLLRPTEDGTYNFWIYICPFDAGFSAKAAVKRLREVVDDGVAPWGTIKMNSLPLIDQLVAATTQTDLPTEVGDMVKKIWHRNHEQYIIRQQSMKIHALDIYKEDK